MTVTIEELKRELGITWYDAETNAKITAACDRAEAYLEMRAGRMLNFKADEYARQLLFDLNRYIYSDAFNQFSTDYAEELLNLRLLGGDTVETK